MTIISQIMGLPRRLEPISGQNFSYVKLDDVLAIFSVDASDHAPQASEPTVQQAIDRERNRCATICQSWIDTFEGKEINYTSARDYAVDAVSDILDLITEGQPAASRSAASTVEPIVIEAVVDEWFDGKVSTDLTYMASFAPDGYGCEKGARLRNSLATFIETKIAAPTTSPEPVSYSKIPNNSNCSKSSNGSPEQDRLALGDIVEVHPDAPYAAEWANTIMKVVSLRVEPNGRRWVSVIEGNPRHRGNGFYDSETDCIEEDHLRRVAVPRNDRGSPAS